MGQMDHYCTLDLYEAAYLIEKDCQLLDVRAHAGGRRVEFFFPASAAPIAATFGQGQVNARAFGHTLRDLKIKMYAVKSA